MCEQVPLEGLISGHVCILNCWVLLRKCTSSTVKAFSTGGNQTWIPHSHLSAPTLGSERALMLLSSFKRKNLSPSLLYQKWFLSRREQERIGILFLQAEFILFISSFPEPRFLPFHHGFGPVLWALVHPISFIECLNDFT